MVHDEPMKAALTQTLRTFAFAAATSMLEHERTAAPDEGGWSEPILSKRPHGYLGDTYDASNFQGTVRLLQSDVQLSEFKQACDVVSAKLLLRRKWGVEDFLIAIATSVRWVMYFEQAPLKQDSFADRFLENCKQLERAAKGQEVRITSIVGLAGLSFVQIDAIKTPWGPIRCLPQMPTNGANSGQQRSTAMLVTTLLTPITPLVQGSSEDPLQAVRDLLPIGFAQVGEPGDRRCPFVTFTLQIAPWQLALSVTAPFSPQLTQAAFIATQESAPNVEDRLQALGEISNPGLQIAARRIALALRHRHNAYDKLIDAVTAWEAMVGSTTETAFKVCAAMTRLLGTPEADRLKKHSELSKIYSARSRIVHGEPPKDIRLVFDQAQQATEIALTALEALQKLGHPWLAMKPEDRAKRLILIGPQ